MSSATKRKPARKNGKGAEFSGVAALAAATADSLDGILKKIDGEVFQELTAIAGQIGSLRKEIARLQPVRMHRHSIPAAGKELESIVSATEAASNRIMECAEQVVAADARNPTRYKALVDARMTEIFEACEFQDLTGQRIAKIVDTLKQIEMRVARFANAPRRGQRGAARNPKRAAKTGGNSQEAIDRLLGGRPARR